MSDWVDISSTAAADTEGSHVGDAPADDPSTSCHPEPVTAHLVQAGMNLDDAMAVVGVTGATSVADLAMVDTQMAIDAATQAGLKMIPAQKWKKALHDLRRGHASTAVSDTSTSSASASTSAAAEPEAAVVQECVAIAIDRSGSMRTGFDEAKAHGENAEKTLEKRSRMDAVKQVFYAFRDRTETLGHGAHQVGLFQFDSIVEEMLPLTDALDTFEAVVDDMQPRGQTAIYSAIIGACRMLEPVHATSPDTDLRVLALTDGQNNTGAPPLEALRAANRIGAVVDAIIIGDKPDDNLRKIAKCTGGSVFHIASLSDGFELMEAESVVSLRSRRGGEVKPAFEARPESELLEIFESATMAGLTKARAASKVATGHTPKATKVVDLGTLTSRVGVETSNASGGASAKATSSGGSVKRIMKELTSVAKGNNDEWLHSGEGIHLFPDNADVHLMKALIEGPAGSVFAGGVFALNIRVPQDYPFRAPHITFETVPYHCNVSESGAICLDILQSGWGPQLSIPKALESIRVMLKDPDTENALRQWIAELTLAYRQSGDVRYETAARAATQQDASRTVEQWRAHWGV